MTCLAAVQHRFLRLAYARLQKPLLSHGPTASLRYEQRLMAKMNCYSTTIMILALPPSHDCALVAMTLHVRLPALGRAACTRQAVKSGHLRSCQIGPNGDGAGGQVLAGGT